MRLGQREVDRTLDFASLTNTRRGFVQTKRHQESTAGTVRREWVSIPASSAAASSLSLLLAPPKSSLTQSEHARCGGTDQQRFTASGVG
jgi:hypothetical protein